MKLEEIKPGQELYWQYEGRGGYGFVSNVHAKVLKVGSARVQIEVTQTRRGYQQVNEKIKKWVSPDKLRERKQ